MDKYVEDLMFSVCERCAVLDAYEDQDTVLETFCRTCHTEAAVRAALSRAYSDGFQEGVTCGLRKAERRKRHRERSAARMELLEKGRHER